MTSRNLVTMLFLMQLVGCSDSKAPATTAAVPEPTQAGVADITPGLADYFVFTKTGVAANQVLQERKEPLLQELTKLAAVARVEAANMTPALRDELELQRIETLAHAAAVSAGVFAAPSDADLDAAYQQFRATLPARDYHVAHILVATENMANSAIVRLQGGALFALVAKELSADDSTARGGDIGWIAPGKLPREFTDAAASLKVGEFTIKPVHTIYGWHVIRLLDSRASNPPPFEQVKAQLVTNLQQQRYQKFLDASL